MRRSNTLGTLLQDSPYHDKSEASTAAMHKKKRSLKDCALNPPKEEVLEETSDWHPT